MPLPRPLRPHGSIASRAIPLILLVVTPLAGEAQTRVTGWEVAGPYPASQVVREAYPNFYAIFLAPWVQAQTDQTGLVNLGAHFPRQDPGSDLALARATFFCSEDVAIDLTLEYAEEVDLFFNGWRVYSGQRPYAIRESTSRPFAPGTERIPLYAKAGMNEVFLMVSSTSSDWGFRAETNLDLHPVPVAPEGPEEVWVTPDTFLTPESVVKDPRRDVLYVSNFDNEYGQKEEPSGYISRLGMTGEILDHRWVDHLSAPTGMDIWRDTLFVAERENLLAIALESGEIANRWPIPDPVFPNDLIIDEGGAVYISDTRTGDWADSRIYRFRDGQFDVFANEGISRANGLWIQDNWLIVGSSGDGMLKRVELSTGRMENIVSFGSGIIDGIRSDLDGSLLVSRWEGQVFRVSARGEVVELMDALPDRWNTADFEFLPEEELLIIPTFLDNRVRAFRMAR